jgi:hypothetical protein
MTDRTYGTRLPRMPEEALVGKLVVVEGADRLREGQFGFVSSEGRIQAA